MFVGITCVVASGFVMEHGVLHSMNINKYGTPILVGNIINLRHIARVENIEHIISMIACLHASEFMTHKIALALDHLSERPRLIERLVRPLMFAEMHAPRVQSHS